MLLNAHSVTIGQRVKQLRVERHISQDDLAAKVGVAQSAISKLERNLVGDPGAMMLAGIADRLGVTVDELIGPTRLAPGSGKTGAVATSALAGDAFKPPGPPVDRLRAIEERVDLLTRVIRSALGSELEAAMAEQEAADRRSSRKGPRAS